MGMVWTDGEMVRMVGNGGERGGNGGWAFCRHTPGFSLDRPFLELLLLLFAKNRLNIFLKVMILYFDYIYG